ncbi:MAG: hypothetical protein ABJH68_06530 [Ilumatobacter sp.]|uniref:hypothetical protein n=1 Tax=Ilumatobacter sp. TaxID=1967498 RepID=UPI0032985AF9
MLATFMSMPAWARVLLPVGLIGFAVLASLTGSPAEDDTPTVSATESARFIWEQEAETYDFCAIYWYRPIVTVTQEFMKRASGMDDPDAVTDRMLSIASTECPKPLGWTEDDIVD